ncbi:hypothetical protein PoB_001085500 [Plakobranchus ocellatus]|uniref:Uncharacterized protein n=1 Tax=Plakobranchus ocellatus TaxID=259542 RepID=A0AAV3YMM7_9GAST|nr:hypothetical protein PoB_001085500 [Plakobranchus ocellatus]
MKEGILLSVCLRKGVLYKSHFINCISHDLSVRFKGNKLNELKGGNKKFCRAGDGVGFQPTITHHYVFRVSMGRSRRWPPYRHHIAEHTSACARSPWTSHHGATKFPSPATKRTKK